MNVSVERSSAECNSIEETYYKKNRDVILSKAKDYHKNDQERLREKARDKFRNLWKNMEKYLSKNMEETDIIICLKKRN